jgi:hypothetical protein
MADSTDVRAVHSGQAAHTRPVLAVYDLVVLGFFCRLAVAVAPHVVQLTVVADAAAASCGEIARGIRP